MDDYLLHLMFTDVGCFNNGYTGWGLVLRDVDGTTTFSACKREDIEVEPALAEALGVRWALQIALAQHLDNIIILSDAANVVNFIAKRTSLASIELIAQDYRELLCNFSNVSIKFISRVSNVDAHNVASLAKFVGSRTWMGNAPPVSIFQSAVPSFHGYFQALVE